MHGFIGLKEEEGHVHVLNRGVGNRSLTLYQPFVLFVLVSNAAFILNVPRMHCASFDVFLIKIHNRSCVFLKFIFMWKCY